MSNKISELLRAASVQAVPIVRGIGPEQFKEPTPCAEYRVAELLNHLFQVVVNFQALAAREAADFSTAPDYLHGDWADRFEAETAALVDAWSVPSALEGVSLGMKLPQETVGQMALLDLTIHPWDLARATGQSYTPDEAAVQELYALVEGMGSTARKMKVFGEALPVPADACDFDRLLALTGRDPIWTH